MAAPRWPRLRKALRWLRRGLLGLVLLVVSALAWVLGSEAGTRWAVRLGLSQYAGLIAGDAHLGEVRGALLHGLELRDLVLTDAAGTERVRVRTLSLDWAPAALWAGALPIRLSGVGVRVHLGPGADAAPLTDLAPPPGPPAPPAPPSDTPPSVPVAVEAWLTLSDVQITVPDGPPRVDLRYLALGATAAGTQVTVGVHRLAVRAPEAEVRALTLGARWDGAVAWIDALDLDSDLGRVRASNLRADPGAKAGRLRLDAQAFAAALAPLLSARGLQPLPADATVALEGGGDPRGFGLTLRAAVGAAAEVTLRLDGALVPQPQLELTVDLAGLDPDALGADLGGAFAGQLRARVEAPPTPLADLGALRPADLTATVHARCDACRLPPVGRFSVAVDGSLRHGAGQLTADAEALGISAQLFAHLDDALAPIGSALTARWQVVAPDVGRAARLGKVKARGRLRTSGACTGDLDQLACAGHLHVAGLAAQGVTADAVSVGYDVAPLAVPPAFDARVVLQALAVPGAPHPISGRVTARGTPESVALTAKVHAGADQIDTALHLWPGPPLRLRLDHLRARARGVAVASRGRAQVRLSPAGAVSVEGLRLRTLGGRVAVDGRFHAGGRSDLRVRLARLDLARLRRFVPQPALAGRLNADLTLRGALSAADVKAKLDLDGLSLDAHPVGDLDLDARLTPRLATAALRLRHTEARALTVDARLPVRANLAQGRVRPRLAADGALSWRGTQLDSAWLAPLARLPDDVRFAVNTSGQAEGRQGRWTATATVDGTAGAGPVAPAPFTLGLEVGPQSQTLTLDATVTPPVPEAAPVPVQVRATTALDVEALARGARPDLNTALTAHVRVPPTPLAPLNPLLPATVHDLQGTLDTDVRVAGTLADPQLAGGLTLSEGAVTVLPLGQRLRELAGTIALDGRTVRFDDLRFRAADGRGAVTGQATLAPDRRVTANLGLRLDDLPVLAPSAPPMRVNTRVSVTLERPAEGTTAVAVRLRKTDVELVELAGAGPRPIPSNPNIVYVDAAGVAARRAAEAEAAGQAPPPPMDLVIDLTDPARIHGRILDMAWGGKIKARLGAEPVIEGALEAQGGFVEMLGNRFELAEGQITLARGASPVPFVRIKAQVDTDEALVTANIRGNATAPSLEFSAEPPLEESQILTLLVTGSTTPSDEDRQSVSEQAGALFASFSSPRFERALQDKLGVDRVRLTFGEGGLETPVLSFGKHLTRRLYVEARYRPNPTPTENESELSARLKLRRRWTLESRYGDLGMGDLGVFWDVPLARD